MSGWSIKWLWQKPMGIGFTGAILLTTGYCLWILTNHYNLRAEQITSSLLMVLFPLLSGFLAVYLSRQKHMEANFRRGWLLVGLALFSSSIAKTVQFYFETIRGVNPFPSLTVFIYLAFYPLILAGVLFFPIVALKREERLTLIVDLCIVMISCAMVFWFFILAPIAGENRLSPEGITGIIYPIGDLLLLVGIIALLQKDNEILTQLTLIFLAVSMFMTAVADILFAYFNAIHIPFQLPHLNILRVCAGLFMLLALAWQIQQDQYTHIPSPLLLNRSQIIMRQSLPYLVAAVAPLMFLLTLNPALILSRRLYGLLIGTLALIILILIRQFVVLIENMHLYEELQQLAITDGLTKIYNRHFFDLIFQREIDRARRYNKSLCLLMMDVDDFKFFNDHFGHLQGDEVLRMIAQILARNLRKTDILARFGGDEFAAILSETDMDGARSVVHKLQAAVSSTSVLDHGLGISVGAAQFRAGMTPEQFIEAADKDLYERKNVY